MAPIKWLHAWKFSSRLCWCWFDQVWVTVTKQHDCRQILIQSLIGPRYETTSNPRRELRVGGRNPGILTSSSVCYAQTNMTLANSRGHYGEEEDEECFSEWSCWIPSSGMSTSSLPCSHLSQVTRSLRHPRNVVARWRWRSWAFLHLLCLLELAQLSSLPTLRGNMFFEGIQIALKFQRRRLAYRSAIGSAFSDIPLNQ